MTIESSESMGLIFQFNLTLLISRRKYLWAKLGACIMDFRQKLIQFVVFIAGLFAILIMISCSSSDEIGKMNIPEDSVVKIDINGHGFDVPLRYMYGETIEKWGNWPKAKKDRIKVDYLKLSMLLPELRPYYPEDDARWKVLGHGERIEVSVMKPVGGIVGTGWFESSLKRTNDSASQGRFYHRENEKYGLTRFSEKNGSRYFDERNRDLAITCDSPNDVPSPSCKVKSHYREDIVFEYYYGLNYLPQWREIDDNLKKLFDQFALSADTNSNK
jgi:hypothetical protein